MLRERANYAQHNTFIIFTSGIKFSSMTENITLEANYLFVNSVDQFWIII